MMFSQFIQSNFIYVAVFACLAVDFYMVSAQKREWRLPLYEFVINIVCSNTLFFYITFKIFWFYQRLLKFPEIVSVPYVINWLLVFSIMLLFALSYVTRSARQVSAKGIQEFLIPVICAFLPFCLIESVSLPQNLSALKWLFQTFYIQSPLYWNPFSIALILFGQSLTLAGIVKLRRSFSILTEVRGFVQGGIYKWIRHPLYVGHTLSMIGLLFLSPSWFNILMTTLFTVLERYRASLEERKLKAVFAEYELYMKRTGAYFPRVFSSQPPEG